MARNAYVKTANGWELIGGSSSGVVVGSTAPTDPNVVWMDTTSTGGQLALDDLSDVTIASATSGQLVQYNGTAWVNSSTVRDGVAATAASGVGFMGMPQLSKSASYTLAISDSGKHVYMTVTGQTITIPANSSVAFPIGATISIINGSGVTTNIAITTDTLIFANTAGTTGTRTLAQYGMATLVKIAATTWIIGGNGLS
jgi:hypothetical protein